MRPDAEARGGLPNRHRVRRLSAQCNAIAHRPAGRHGDMAVVGQITALFDPRRMRRPRYLDGKEACTCD
jgi:hypothetical protein